jgi:hypothetical protein
VAAVLNENVPLFDGLDLFGDTLLVECSAGRDDRACNGAGGFLHEHAVADVGHCAFVV